MQNGKQPFRARSQLFARLTLNAGKHAGNQPARLAQLDDGNDCAILVQGDEGPAQVVLLGHRGTPSVICQRRWCHLIAACPIPSLRWREVDSNPRSRRKDEEARTLGARFLSSSIPRRVSPAVCVPPARLAIPWSLWPNLLGGLRSVMLCQLFRPHPREFVPAL